MQQSFATLDTISLTEEELSVLFGAASYSGADCYSTLRQPHAALHSRISTRMSSTQSNRSKVKTASANLHPLRFNVSGDGFVPAYCGYRTGKCPNPQAFKRNGKLHKLCELHRERANMNQKKLDRKKRMQRSNLPDETHSSCESVSSASSITINDDNRRIDLKSHSPRIVESAVTGRISFPTKLNGEHDELDTEMFLPTSLHEAPPGLGSEELAIFCSLMTFDVSVPLSRNTPFVRTPSCHYSTSIA